MTKRKTAGGRIHPSGAGGGTAPSPGTAIGGPAPQPKAPGAGPSSFSPPHRAERPFDPLTCAEAIELMGVYLAHEMTFQQRDAFVAHLRGCEACHDKLLTLEIQLHLCADDDGPPAWAGG